MFKRQFFSVKNLTQPQEEDKKKTKIFQKKSF